MDPIMKILSANWLDAIILIGRICLALAGCSPWRPKVIGRLDVVSLDSTLFDRTAASLPPEAVLQYRNKEVERLSSSIVWVWNDGNGTLQKSEIADLDQLSLKFDGRILDHKIRGSTNIAISGNTELPSNENRVIRYSFEFLNPRDGLVLEVLHTGTSRRPECLGTVKNPSRTPRYKGRAHGVRVDPWEKPMRAAMFVTTCFLLLIGVFGLLGIHDDEIARLFYRDDAPAWFYGVLGSLAGFTMAWTLWFSRRRVQRSLVIL